FLDRAETIIDKAMNVTMPLVETETSPVFDECRLDLLLRRVVDEYRGIYGNRFYLGYGTSVSGYWCEEALSQVIRNLLSNAVKFGGSTTPITVVLDQTDKETLLTVSNEGSFISDEEKASLFEP